MSAGKHRPVQPSGSSALYVIEIEQAVVGILVGAQPAYRFFATSPDFALLEGSRFASPGAATEAVERLHRAVGPLAGQASDHHAQPGSSG